MAVISTITASPPSFLIQTTIFTAEHWAFCLPVNSIMKTKPLQKPQSQIWIVTILQTCLSRPMPVPCCWWIKICLFVISQEPCFTFYQCLPSRAVSVGQPWIVPLFGRIELQRCRSLLTSTPKQVLTQVCVIVTQLHNLWWGTQTKPELCAGPFPCFREGLAAGDRRRIRKHYDMDFVKLFLVLPCLS